MFKEQISVEGWKSKIKEGWGDNVSYREVGKYGWDRLVDVNKNGVQLEHHNNGPHYIDAAPKTGSLKRMGKLIGTYDFITGTGTIFSPIDTDTK